jgi:hypothetical protein
MQAMRTALEASAREYIGSVPKSTLKIRLLKPPGANDTGPGFSATMPSPRQLDYLTRAVALDADRMSGAALAAVDGGQAGTFRLTPTPRPDESFAPGTAPSVSRTIPGSAKARSNYGELDDPFVPKPRSSWGKLALVAIPLGAVIGLTLNALQPREQAADPAAAAASVATPPAVVEPPPTTPPPPATIPPSPVASDPPPSPSVTAVATVTPPPVRAPSVRKRTTAAASSTAPSPPPSPPPTKADSAKTEPPKSDAPKTDLDRMRERARKFEEETRGTGKAP